MGKVIIDGVDVSGCVWYFKANGNCDNEQLIHKCDGDNCYYKQLKRLEQEISKYATDLIDGVKSGCEDDIGTILLKMVNKVTGE